MLAWFSARSDGVTGISKTGGTSTGEHPGNRCACGRGWAFTESGVCFKCAKEAGILEAAKCMVCSPVDPKEKLWTGTKLFAPEHTINYSLCRCADCGYMATLGPKDVAHAVLGDKTVGPTLRGFFAEREPGISPTKQLLNRKMNDGYVHTGPSRYAPQEVATELFPASPARSTPKRSGLVFHTGVSPASRSGGTDARATSLFAPDSAPAHRRPTFGSWNPYGEWVTTPKSAPRPVTV